MTEVKFTDHARKRLQEREIPEQDVINAVKDPDDVLFDADKGNLVAVKKVGDVHLIVVYAPSRPLRIISVIQTSKLNIVENRIRKGRWVRL
ncbi:MULTISPECIES: DUF4258 domain-containing protein [unclassified Archaeoglobus]|jgi:uncharacterized DUF497 family protein|uniref:DUF4258 domain-containing protein n=1 Tax=unclassified Archaeoglobus TaxID=2643606 RepID=UPI0025BDB4A7|nr:MULTISPECIES: DUF4258 domain-containing protein [unclassified Archaeoglobus]